MIDQVSMEPTQPRSAQKQQNSFELTEQLIKSKLDAGQHQTLYPPLQIRNVFFLLQNSHLLNNWRDQTSPDNSYVTLLLARKYIYKIYQN